MKVFRANDSVLPSSTLSFFVVTGKTKTSHAGLYKVGLDKERVYDSLISYVYGREGTFDTFLIERAMPGTGSIPLFHVRPKKD